jgi:nucleoside-diphosphate-sugar epimerase
LLARGDTVVGIDNHNDYYDPALKKPAWTGAGHPATIYVSTSPAARRWRPRSATSLDNPLAYIDSNIVGFGHILEGCRHHGIEHLVYASSSSVYGANTAMPFSTHDNVDHPLSLYAATKKANELMAHTYSHLFGLPTTGLRFFTVYGPWGRPDMALFKFTRPSSPENRSRCSITASTGAISPTSTTSSKASSAFWTIPRRPTPTGAAIIPIPAPARLPGGSTTSATTSRN